MKFSLMGEQKMAKNDVVLIPSNMVHGAKMSDLGCDAIDIFWPARTDYAEKEKARMEAYPDRHGFTEMDVDGLFGSNHRRSPSSAAQAQASVFRAKGTTGTLQRLASFTPSELNFWGIERDAARGLREDDHGDVRCQPLRTFFQDGPQVFARLRAAHHDRVDLCKETGVPLSEGRKKRDNRRSCIQDCNR